jgi:hypothetical protein
LRHDGILTGAQKRLDFEILFDPFEEQFNLPALFVDIGDGFAAPVELVSTPQRELGAPLKVLPEYRHREPIIDFGRHSRDAKERLVLMPR